MKCIFTLLFAVMVVGQVLAQTTFTVDGLKYTVTDEENHHVSVGRGSTVPTGVLSIQEKVTNPNDGLEYMITSIGRSAFGHCSGLTSVTIPNSVTSISNSAFNGCSGLTSVTIPNSVISIGDYAFNYCSGLTSVIISNSITSIGRSAFNHCRGLTSITIPNSVTSIDISTFSNCSSLISATIESSIISEMEFYGCSALKSVTISNSVTSICKQAFSRCTSLTSVTIPNSVTSIDDNAFVFCNSLTSITIPHSVTSIGNGVFNACSKLEEISVESVNTNYTSENGILFNKAKTNLICYPAGKTGSYIIPNTVTSIGCYAFHRSGLTSITIPNSVISIEEYSFSNCSDLTSICYEGNSEPTYQSNSFDDVDKTIPVYVPIDYASDTWCGFQVHKHNLVTISAIPATCTETGLSEGRYCSDCDVVLIAQTIIPALGHNYGTTVTAPTCTAVGYTTHTCSVCEYAYNSDTVAAKGHTYNNTVTNPTCTAVGYTTHACSVCEYTYNSDTVAAKGHSYDNIVTNPTCTEEGFTTHTCSVCEYTYYSDTIAAKGHKADSVEFENIIPATCTAAGSKDSVVFCSVCQVEISREERAIPALGHTEVVNEAVAPTCTKAGKTEGKYCSVCNTVIKLPIAIPATGHKADSVEFENIMPATCTVAGSKDSVVFCSVCEVELSREERAIPALGHTEVTDAAVPATCTATGKTEGKHCSVCNDTIVAQEEIPALGHEFKDYVYNNDATITADGTEIAICTRGCGATDTRTAAGTKLAETPEKGTAVAESTANAVTIYAHGNTIVVENATYEISVYDAMGKLICRDATPCVRTEINVNAPGVYIVKVGGTAKRVMVN